METVSIRLEKRESAGKNHSRALRKDGKIPVVLYSSKNENYLGIVNSKELSKNLKKGKTILFNIESTDSILNGKRAFIKDIDKDPVSDKILHIDFYIVPEKELIKIDVPIKLTGKPIGVTKGGILEQERHEITIKTMPENVPDFIEVDVSSLDIGDSIHFGEIKLPEGVSLAENPSIAVATVVPPKEERELTEEEKKAQLEASLAETKE
ncbi:MAG: 50S ribosomal protein L25 [Proteobacteria bacterium]|nr:50S ribosomal protein L25 [Pseudomonadota bacterium]